MANRQTSILVFWCIWTSLFSQNDTLSKISSNGKRQGYWLQYLDLRLNPIDSSNSYYKRFEFYDNGKLICPLRTSKLEAKCKIHTNAAAVTKGHPVFLTGNFKWHFHDDTIPTIEKEFKDGYPVFEKCFHWLIRPNLQYVPMTEVFEYTKSYHNIPGTYYSYEVNFETAAKLRCFFLACIFF
jgi:hypothetical protein